MEETGMAEKIRQLRISQKLTLEQVANEVGVGKSTVRKWETGMIANMRRDKIASLARALHTTPEYLMGWEKEKRSEPETDSDLEEITNIFNSLNPDNRAKLLELSRLYLDAQRKKEQTP